MAKKTRGLGRRPSVDERDRLHLMARELPATLPARPIRKTWRLWWKGDQGKTSECVGYSWYAMLRALPLLQREPLPETIYHDAQRLDEWEGEDYDGTSVRAGAKALQVAGKIRTYAWAFELEAALNWLAIKGPVVLGTDWLQDMFTPGADGIVRVSGSVAGGHAYLALGYDDKAKLLICQNSWSTAWGKSGRFFIRYADADRLIKEGGEACTATE